jgi:hypothetical protein
MKPLIIFRNYNWDAYDKEEIKNFALKSSTSGNKRGLFKNKNVKKRIRRLRKRQFYNKLNKGELL